MMEYNILNLTEDELIEYIADIPSNLLKLPIINNPKKFQAQIKGFRPQGISFNIIKTIYKKQVFQNNDPQFCTLLNKYTEDLVSILEIGDIINSDSPLIDIAKEIEIELLNKGKKVSVVLLLKIAGKSITIEDEKIIKFASDYLQEIRSRFSKKEESTKKEVVVNVETEKHYKKELKKEQNKVKQLESEIDTLHIKIDDLKKQNNQSIQTYKDKDKEKEIIIHKLNEEIDRINKDKLLKEAEIKKERKEKNDVVLELSKIKKDVELKYINKKDYYNIILESIENLTGYVDFDIEEIKQIFIEDIKDNMDISELFSKYNYIIKRKIGYIVNQIKERKLSEEDVASIQNLEDMLSAEYYLLECFKNLLYKNFE